MIDDAWQTATQETVNGYRQMVDAAVEQLSDEQLVRRHANGFNSVAVILRHMGGNLQSRWTDFLTSDGEKPDRNRDAEFEDWPGTRNSLMEYFDAGWKCLTTTLDALTMDDLQSTVLIRGEKHSVQFAIVRSITHLSYHVGQIMLIARLMQQESDASWKWLTIAPNSSRDFNSETWGTSASRGIAGQANQEQSGEQK